MHAYLIFVEWAASCPKGNISNTSLSVCATMLLMCRNVDYQIHPSKSYIHFSAFSFILFGMLDKILQLRLFGSIFTSITAIARRSYQHS